MELREYFFRNNIQIKDFAKKIDFSATMISRVSWKRIRPGRKLLKAIVEGTEGQVTAEEILKDMP